MDIPEKQNTESSKKQLTQTQQNEIWITFGDNGKIRSAPLNVFQKIAKERGWKPEKQDKFWKLYFIYEKIVDFEWFFRYLCYNEQNKLGGKNEGCFI